jgi:hypothetical protein
VGDIVRYSITKYCILYCYLNVSNQLVTSSHLSLLSLLSLRVYLLSNLGGERSWSESELRYLHLLVLVNSKMIRNPSN